MQKAAYTSDSIAIAAQQILSGGNPATNQHVPYAFNDVPCDITLSNIHKNIEALPLFYSGGMIELNYAYFFCVFIKREILEKFRELVDETDREGQLERVMSDFV